MLNGPVRPYANIKHFSRVMRTDWSRTATVRIKTLDRKYHVCCCCWHFQATRHGKLGSRSSAFRPSNAECRHVYWRGDRSLHQTKVNKVIISMIAYPRLKTRVQAENDEVTKRNIIQLTGQHSCILRPKSDVVVLTQQCSTCRPCTIHWKCNLGDYLSEKMALLILHKCVKCMYNVFCSWGVGQISV